MLCPFLIPSLLACEVRAKTLAFSASLMLDTPTILTAASLNFWAASRLRYPHMIYPLEPLRTTRLLSESFKTKVSIRFFPIYRLLFSATLLLLLYPVPVSDNVAGIPDFGIPEDVRMPALKLADKPFDNVFNVELPAFGSDLGSEHHV